MKPQHPSSNQARPFQRSGGLSLSTPAPASENWVSTTAVSASTTNLSGSKLPSSGFNSELSNISAKRTHAARSHSHHKNTSTSSSAEGTKHQEDFKPAKLHHVRKAGRRRGEDDSHNKPHHRKNELSKSDPSNRSNRHVHDSEMASSVVFQEDSALFDELDALDPHKHEGGDLVRPPDDLPSGQSSVSFTGENAELSKSNTTNRNGSLEYSSLSKSMTSNINRQFAASLIQSLQNKNTTHLNHIVPPNVPPTSSSAERDSFVSAISSGNTAVLSRASIVGGKPINKMTFDEQRKIMAPYRRESSLVIQDGDSDDGVLDFLNDKFDNVTISSNGKGDDNCRVSKPQAQDPGCEGSVYSSLTNRSHQTICTYSPTKSNQRYSNEPNIDVVVSSVDWSSLTKSCKRAKNAFRDEDSGLIVVKNMFLTHLNALTTALIHYAKRYCRESKKEMLKMKGNSHAAYAKSLDVISTRTTETKRALRFGLACLAPSRAEDGPTQKTNLLINPLAAASSSISRGSFPTRGTDFRDDVERYCCARRSRQEMQEAAVEGAASSQEISSEVSSPRDREHRHGVQLPLVEIILGLRPWTEKEDDTGESCTSSPWDIAPDVSDEDLLFELSSIQSNQSMIPVLAARMLCNLVTDNPIAAEAVLIDVPFGPTQKIVQKRMSISMMHGELLLDRVDLNDMLDKREDGPICWSDLITSTAKLVSTIEGDEEAESYRDREVLAAVAAAIHNLLASLETRDSLFQLENEAKRREKLKDLRMRRRSTAMLSEAESENEQEPLKPADAGIEAASNRPLMNALLRSILPAKEVILHSMKTQTSQIQSRSSSIVLPESEEPSDSATEWISLVLERMASRGLLPLMFHTAGSSQNDSTVTPEKVVLTSCIRQAVDDYHSARAASGDCGEFGRRRLSIAAKSAGMTVLTRPHPLWGRVDEDFGGGGIGGGIDLARGMPSSKRRDPGHFNVAIRILIFIANEVDRLRLQMQSLQAGYSKASGDEVAEIYEGELSCTRHIIDDFRDILSQSLGKHASFSSNNHSAQRHKQCILAEARLVLGRDTDVIQNCCMDLAYIVDNALASNHGKNARELKMTPQDQQSAVILVRLLGNVVYRCRQNQDLFRVTQIPLMDNRVPVAPTATTRTGLHVLLSATSLATACFTLREWCIVAIRNAVEDNDANAEAVRMLEANEALSDTPELRNLGVKIGLDAKGKVHVQRRDSTT